MLRLALAAALALALAVPGAIAARQVQAPSGRSPATHRSHAPNDGSRLHGRHRRHDRRGHGPWWSRSVTIGAGAASDYLATPTPAPQRKNKVDKPGAQVFKRISN